MSNQDFLRKELLDLQVKADELDSENIKLTKGNEKFTLENKKLKSKISELNNQLCNTIERKEFDDLTIKYENLIEKFETLDRNYKRLKKDDEVLNDTLEQCLRTKNDLDIKCETYKKENVELKGNLNELKNISKQTLKDAAIKGEEIEEQQKLIQCLKEENESLKNHLNYFKEQNRKSTSMMSWDSFSADPSNISSSVPESMDIIVETKLRDCQKQLEETENRLTTKEQESNDLNEQVKRNQIRIQELENEICLFEKQKTESKNHLENDLNQKMIQMKADYDLLNSALSAKDEQLNLNLQELNNVKKSIDDNQFRINELVNQLDEKTEEFKVKKTELEEFIENMRIQSDKEKAKLKEELELNQIQYDQERTKLKEQQRLELDKLVQKLNDEINSLNFQNEQKLGTLTVELKRQEEEKLKKNDEITQLTKLNEELKLKYDQLLEEKNSELMDLVNENEKLNLEFNQLREEIESINKCLDDQNELTLKQSKELDELKSVNESILNERNEFKKQVQELKSALENSKTECSQLFKRHQDEMFKLTQEINKKQEDIKMSLDLQATFEDLKSKDDQLNELKYEIDRFKEMVSKQQIKIEQFKSNEREKNLSTYLLNQELKELNNKKRDYELHIKKLEANLKCTEESFELERKTKERYYRELTALEQTKCSECIKLQRSNSVSYMPHNQTLVIKKNQPTQKIPGTNKFPMMMMEDEDGQFMSNTTLNELRKRKTENNSQDDFNKRLNILQQRNSQVPPHLKSSYPLEFQEKGNQNLNEKIKNSEKFDIVFDENKTRNPPRKTLRRILNLEKDS